MCDRSVCVGVVNFRSQFACIAASNWMLWLLFKGKNFQTKSPSYARENRLTYMQHLKTNGQVNVSPEGVTKWKSTEKLSEPKINAE